MASVVKIVSKTFWEFVTILLKWHTIISFNWQIHTWPVVLQLNVLALAPQSISQLLAHIQVHNYLRLWMIRISESWQQAFIYHSLALDQSVIVVTLIFMLWIFKFQLCWSKKKKKFVLNPHLPSKSKDPNNWYLSYAFVLICLCCYNNIPQTVYLIKTEIYFSGRLEALEAGSLRSGCQHD